MIEAITRSLVLGPERMFCHIVVTAVLPADDGVVGRAGAGLGEGLGVAEGAGAGCVLGRSEGVGWALGVG